MANVQDMRRILRGSFRYEIEDDILELTGYYSGERIRINLAEMDQETFEELVVEDEDEEDW